ncbi:chromate efflux transporter [Paracoccus liaowanqingii]|uniref:Chromate efflux transporter n=1 Tax=Paracoccus liaowanqingii TaxID=2560053 RepID=A0A4P7HKA2_9RHOB|nr:chromate efflux transporter [Paracoccus liaowanqingii]QBX34053.1 chromate efflux transporter [Paracoccus liaowanqingii]
MPTAMPTLHQSFWVWARIAALSFGGPAGQIAVMHRILVDEQRWIDEPRFLHALNFCMLLPGPEAQQLATYVGWLTGGVRGALIAGVLFILPGALSIMALSWIYITLGDVPAIEGLFFGLKAAVLALVVQAVIRLAGRALPGPGLRGLALVAFLALFALDAPFPLVIAGAALIGAVALRTAPPDPAALPRPDDRTDARAARIAAVWALALWLAPVAALLVLAPGSVFTEIAVFFSKLAVLTFGGAYAVLAWVAQEAAGPLAWLTPAEMLDGLGMAETTPGPLIMVLQFVGFLAALREAGWANPLGAATLGGLLATWVTFAPCFAWIFLGAPYMERLRANARLAGALRAVTAAVVGVILNLGLWFALHLIWRQTRPLQAGPVQVELPVWSSLDPAAAGLSALALLAALRFRAGMGALLAGAALAGMALHLAGLTAA